MFNLGRDSKSILLQEKYEKKLQQATESQRQGDIRAYSKFIEEANIFLEQIEILEDNVMAN